MGKTWPEGQGVESGLEASPAAVATIPVASTAAAASATTAAAEGPELELPVPPAAAATSLAAVAATSIAGLALVLDRADVEGGVHRVDRLVRLCHRRVFADVLPDVASHEGHVAVFDQGFTSADTSRRVAKGREKPTTRRIQTMWANCPDEPLL